jgi:hypothetical protein
VAGGARHGYLHSHGFELWQGAASKKNVRPVMRKGMRNRAADVSSCSVDDGVLALEQHLVSSVVCAVLV